MSLKFRFDAGTHEYIELDTGDILPHITGLLEKAGWIDGKEWFTEASSQRGQAVHRLTATYDMGALDVNTCEGRYRAYVLAHAKAMGIVRPDWQGIEEPLVHERHRFGGRPDRRGLAWSLACVWEVKAAIPQRSHLIQTALQAILVAPEMGLPATAIKRYAEYLKPNGKFKIEEHRDERDFREAARIIREYCT